ncbi:MAG: caspase family protein, partial [Prevotella sp.]|nr:caspase family protein [Prevotella sp.]
YDADYQMYALNSNYGQKYVKVPLAQAPSFKNNFQRAVFNASYVPTGEGLKIDNLSITLNGKRYVAEKTAVEVASGIDIELPEIIMASNNTPKAATLNPTVAIDNTIDQNIPTNATNNKQTFAVIIGNESYTQVAPVPYANNDARIFAKYCKKTLGISAQNVRVYENATYGTMLSAIADVKKIAEAYNGGINVIFYYAGHGVPNESTKDAFLLPVDADGQQTEVCYPVSRLYKQLGSLGAKNVVVFMDACFSGSLRGDGMLASARGVKLRAKADAPQGNMVVFSAAQGDETAYPYKEKGHGMFTYFLLKKLQESKGDCTLGELGEYIQTNVRQQAVVVNRKSQTPTVVPSAGISDKWRTMKLK